MDFMSTIQSIIGVVVFIGICYLISEKRSRINWRIVSSGLVLQFALALLILKVPFIRNIFDGLAHAVVQLIGFSDKGAGLVFGKLMDEESMGFIVAFKVLPTIVFFSALTSALYYLNILQRVVFVFAWVIQKFMKISGVECTAAAANTLLGQTEAPLVVKPYLEKMTRSEIMSLMCGGMATMAGAVLAAYVGMLGGSDPEQLTFYARHLLIASIISAPAALMVSKMIVPETEKFQKNLSIAKDKIGENLIDALTRGISEGVKLAVNVGAMLIVFTALLYMFDAACVKVFGDCFGLNSFAASFSEGRYELFDIKFILGIAFSPFAWLIGISPADVFDVGRMLGIKLFLNEFFAYQELKVLIDKGVFTGAKTVVITTYALCGFANFASVGIQVGGIGVLVPSKRGVLSSLGFKALIGGTIACLLTAAIANLIIL